MFPRDLLPLLGPCSAQLARASPATWKDPMAYEAAAIELFYAHGSAPRWPAPTRRVPHLCVLNVQQFDVSETLIAAQYTPVQIQLFDLQFRAHRPAWFMEADVVGFRLSPSGHRLCVVDHKRIIVYDTNTPQVWVSEQRNATARLMDMPSDNITATMNTEQSYIQCWHANGGAATLYKLHFVCAAFDTDHFVSWGTDFVVERRDYLGAILDSFTAHYPAGLTGALLLGLTLYCAHARGLSTLNLATRDVETLSTDPDARMWKSGRDILLYYDECVHVRGKAYRAPGVMQAALVGGDLIVLAEGTMGRLPLE